MKITRPPEGLEAVLSSSGLGRFITGAFLGVWLLFWIAGEGFALWMLLKGAWALFTGEPPEPDQDPLSAQGALPMGLFLLIWLSFWTLGGVFAGREFLRSLFGRDIIRARAEALEIIHSYGLFRSHKSLSREDIRRFYQQPRNRALCVETNRGTTEITRLGSPADRSELEQLLKTEFVLQEDISPRAILPAEWQEIPSAEGESVLVKNPGTRSKQALIAWIVCLPMVTVALFLIASLPESPGFWILELIIIALAGGTAYVAIWFTFGRDEWVLRTGQMVLQRRFRQQRAVRFEAVSVELYEDNSGDDGPSYVLDALAANAPPLHASLRGGKLRKRIWSNVNDPTALRNLGRWLSQRCQIPFDDQTTTEARAMQFEAWKTQLTGSGRLGKAVVRIVDRIHSGNQK